jgi:nucleoside triphosphate pyrophosphatase
MPERLILASASAARAALLREAGIPFEVRPVSIDEARIKRLARAIGDTAIACALALAAEKARAISRHDPEALVIGADQILVADEEWFDKPTHLAEAKKQLQRLRGRTHQLATAACAVCGGTTIWQAASMPELTMRPFSDAFLDVYVAAEDEALLGSVGAYRLERRGIQLFSGIAGDYFAVLGLPLLELLEFLRTRGVAPR